MCVSAKAFKGQRSEEHCSPRPCLLPVCHHPFSSPLSLHAILIRIINHNSAVVPPQKKTISPKHLRLKTFPATLFIPGDPVVSDLGDEARDREFNFSAGFLEDCNSSCGPMLRKLSYNEYNYCTLSCGEMRWRRSVQCTGRPP